jgi:hypothetical protein
VARFDVEPGQDVRREIRQVKCDDYICAGPNRCGEHMPIILIGQRQPLNQVLVAGDETVPDLGVHQLSRPFELLWSEVRPVRQNVPDPFLMNPVRPSSSEQISQRQPH